MEGQKGLSRLSRRDFVGYVSASCRDTFVIAKLNPPTIGIIGRRKCSCHKLNVSEIYFRKFCENIEYGLTRHEFKLCVLIN